ncbi:DUF1289 domain-containing protein [Shewanella electrodiphila]|uniref:DUF1289 domain-containing protein n=2 Tax=Shewanella electrodiphila TaxID=934143 RepID=A0ABT0KPU2_9GAMM|nr:DUF1289 domain-containing protein [Shewanella electrodiphila]MCL1045758.1 DUF1289 domain-containing protein [Shewanella electrodiphila]
MNMQSGPNEPRSPCVGNCCLDQQDICLGCHRTHQEILAWHKMSVDDKNAHLTVLAMRAAQAKKRRQYQGVTQ